MSDPNPYSDLPGTATQTPAQDELEARRTFPPSQQPFPRIPSIPAPKAQPKAAGGGGFSMDTLMPLLLMAAPFLEAHQPGYGMGLVHGVLQHQQEQEQTNRNMILTFAKEFAGTSDEEWPAVAAVLKSQGLNPEQIGTVKNIRGVFRPADYAQQQELRKYTEFFRPELAQHAVTGLSMQDILSRAPERIEAARAAGLQVPGDIRTIQTGVTPGQPGAGELGTRIPPVAPQPITERRVIWPGQENLPTVGQLFPKAQGTPFANISIPANQMGTWLGHAKDLGWITTPQEADAHKKAYRDFLLDKAVSGLRNPGSVDFATLKTQIESPEAGGNFGAFMTKAQDQAAKEIAARPIFVTVGGQTYPVSSADALKIATAQQGQVTIPVNGTMVRMTGDQYANYQVAVARLNRERKELPLRATIQGIDIGSMADLKMAVAAGLIDPNKLDPITRRSLGSDPESIPAQQALHAQRTAEAELASFAPYRTRFTTKGIQEAIDRVVTGKATPADIALLQRDTQTVPISGVATKASDFATSLATIQKKIEYWRGITGGTPPVAPGGQPAPVGATPSKTMSRAELHQLAQAANMTDDQYATLAQGQGYTIGP